MNFLLWKRQSIRRRITLWNVGVLALTLAVLGTSLLYTLRANLLRGADRDLAHFAERVQRQTESPFPPNFARPPHRGQDREGPAGPFGPSLRDLQGRPLFPFLGRAAWDPNTFPAAARGQTVYSTVRFENQPLRVLSVPLRRGGRLFGVAQLARPLADEYAEVRGVTRALLTLIPLALLIAGAGGAFLTGRALRPVRQITQAAGRIGASDLSDRLSVAGDDEFAELAATFNGMLGRLEEAFGRLTQAYEQQRRFTADASHEMRTPLTVIKAQTSLALLEPRAEEDRQTLEAIDAAADRTIRLVQDLLLLARSDAGQMRLSLAPCPLPDILEQARAAVVGPSAPISLEMPRPAPMVCGNADALARLFGNLLTNAARHTPHAGQITVRVEDGGPQVSVRVCDTGEGIAPEHLPHLGERFYRVDTARSEESGGSGLGLAICRSIAEAHGGTLTLESGVGSGTVVTVTLPRA